MIHELRTYTVKSGAAPEMAKNAATIGREVRGNNFGKLEGYWTSDIGPLNQVAHLWSFSDLNERQRLRGELAKNPRWVNEYVPLNVPLLVRQDIRLMHPIIGPVAPMKEGNVYELRNYRLKPGTAKSWLGWFQDVLPIREKYSKIVGLWLTEAGQPNEVCHLWAYPDLNARSAARNGVLKEPAWQEFAKRGSQVLEEMHSQILLPSAHSPLK